MKTAMLYWKKLNPIVKQFPVNKLFYNKYLFKAKIYCPGGRAIYCRNRQDIDSFIQGIISDHYRRKYNLKYNFGGSWYSNHSLHIAERIQKFSQISQLEFYHDIRQKNLAHLRVEDPYVSIYETNEQALYDIISNKFPERLIEIHKPESELATDVLLKGELITSKNVEYSYKVILKPIRFNDMSIKTSLEQQYHNLRDSVHFPKSLKNFLQSDNLVYPGGYFYCKDEHTAFLFRLAFGNIISSIFKITKLDS